LFPEIYEEVLGLLKRGVKVYILKNPSILKKLRIENSMRKSDKDDAVLLSKTSRDRSKLLTVQEVKKRVELRALISEYQLLSRRVKTLRQWIKNNGYDYNLKDAVRLMGKDKKDVAKKIVNYSPIMLSIRRFVECLE